MAGLFDYHLMGASSPFSCIEGWTFRKIGVVNIEKEKNA